MSVLIWIVTIAGVLGCAVMLGIGLRQDNEYNKPMREAVKKVMQTGQEAVRTQTDLAAENAKAGNSDNVRTLEAQSSALDTLGSALEGMAKFADALKGLDAATRDYLIAVVFLFVAVMSASVGQIAG